ncbi:MAG: DUF2393 family protein [Sulfuricurvum sp.]|nr:DUF2393 family protein [Sulfuricurvum sp.]
MKATIIDFIHHLLIYDYFLFGGIFVLFILFLTFSIALRKKIGLAIVFVLLAFAILTAGPVVGYLALHHYLFKHSIVIQQVKALEFTEALLIKGEIKNRSKRPFSECTYHTAIYKVRHNKFIDPIYPFIPFKKSTIILTQSIAPGQSAPFKLIIEPFRYTQDYNLTLKGECR